MAPHSSAGTPENVGRRRMAFARMHRSDNVRTYVPLLIAILALIIYASAKSDLFLTARNIRVLLDSVSVLGLLTVGMTLLLIAGQLDLSVGAGAALAAVVAAKIITGGGSQDVAVVAMLLLPLSVAFLVGLTVVFTAVQPFILTLGLMSVLQAIGYIATGQQPIPVGSHLESIDTSNVIGSTVPLSFAMFVGALVVGSVILHFTRLGRAAYAVGSNERAAFLSGITVGRVKVILFCLSGLLVGVAGLLLLSSLGAGDATSGTGLELQAIAAAVIGGSSLLGGRGSMFGSFLGVMLIGVLENALTLLNVSSFYQQLVLGALLIFAVTATAIAEKRRGSPESFGQILGRMLGGRRLATANVHGQAPGVDGQDGLEQNPTVPLSDTSRTR